LESHKLVYLTNFDHKDASLVQKDHTLLQEASGPKLRI